MVVFQICASFARWMTAGSFNILFYSLCKRAKRREKNLFHQGSVLRFFIFLSSKGHLNLISEWVIVLNSKILMVIVDFRKTKRTVSSRYLILAASFGLSKNFYAPKGSAIRRKTVTILFCNPLLGEHFLFGATVFVSNDDGFRIFWKFVNNIHLPHVHDKNYVYDISIRVRSKVDFSESMRNESIRRCTRPATFSYFCQLRACVLRATNHDDGTCWSMWSINLEKKFSNVLKKNRSGDSSAVIGQKKYHTKTSPFTISTRSRNEPHIVSNHDHQTYHPSITLALSRLINLSSSVHSASQWASWLPS